MPRDGATVLETERLWLTRIASGDHAELTRLYADPEVNRYLGGPFDQERVRDQLARIEKIWDEHGFGQRWLRRKSDGVVVGRAGLHVWPQWDEVEVGFALSASHWGRGYATEAAAAWVRYAFDELGLTRVTSVIHTENEASKRVARRLGMSLDRRDVTPQGAAVEVYELVAVGAAPA